MNWSRVPVLPGVSRRPHKSAYLSNDGLYRVSPIFGRGRRMQRLKSVWWELHEGGRYIPGVRPFASARLAKAFAEELASLAEDRRARREFIRDGGQWCADLERHWRSPNWWPDPRVKEEVGA